MKLKNKRGEVPIIFLVLGVVAICALAILSFIIGGSKINHEFEGVGAVQEMNSAIEVNEFYKNVGMENPEIVDGKIVKKVGTVSVSYNLN